MHVLESRQGSGTYVAPARPISYSGVGKVMGFHSYSLRLHVIHLNQELDEPMLQFVCAHELGHTILHPNINTAFMTHRTFFSASKLEREALPYMTSQGNLSST